MKKFLDGFLFRPQGKPMAYPYTTAAQISQFPWRYMWHEISKKLTGPENTALWREKRKKDAEHHRHEMEKIWEVRT